METDKPRVFLLQDQESILTLWRRLLEFRDFAVLSAHTATEAIRIIRSEDFVGVRVAVLDFDLGERIYGTGLDVARMMKEEKPSVELINGSSNENAFCEFNGVIHQPEVAG